MRCVNASVFGAKAKSLYEQEEEEEPNLDPNTSRRPGGGPFSPTHFPVFQSHTHFVVCNFSKFFQPQSLSFAGLG